MGLFPISIKELVVGNSSFGKDAFDLSIYEKSPNSRGVRDTVLQDTDGQFIGLSVANSFALENDMAELESMKSRGSYLGGRLDLSQLLDHRPQDLSGGQKQQVSLAASWLTGPILLFDEPLANLDPKWVRISLIWSIRFAKSRDDAIIIEHRMEDVLYRPVDRIVLINQGSRFNGQPDELLKTTLLAENGIREPLYLTTLRQLGQDISKAALFVRHNVENYRGRISIQLQILKKEQRQRPS